LYEIRMRPFSFSFSYSCYLLFYCHPTTTLSRYNTNLKKIWSRVNTRHIVSYYYLLSGNKLYQKKKNKCIHRTPFKHITHNSRKILYYVLAGFGAIYTKYYNNNWLESFCLTGTELFLIVYDWNIILLLSN